MSTKSLAQRQAINAANKLAGAIARKAAADRLRAVGINNKAEWKAAYLAAKKRVEEADCRVDVKKKGKVYTIRLLTKNGRFYMASAGFYHCAVNEAFDLKEQHEMTIAEAKIWHNY